MSKIVFNIDTIWPDGFDPEATGAIFTKEKPFHIEWLRRPTKRIQGRRMRTDDFGPDLNGTGVSAGRVNNGLEADKPRKNRGRRIGTDAPGRRVVYQRTFSRIHPERTGAGG